MSRTATRCVWCVAVCLAMTAAISQAQEQGRRRGFGGGFGMGNPTMLLGLEQVQKELGGLSSMKIQSLAGPSQPEAQMLTSEI